MARLFAVILSVAFVWLTSTASAQDSRAAALAIEHPFARATPPGATTGGAYFVVVNRGPVADRLVGVSSPVAGVAEIHTMAMEGNVMRMRAVSALDVPAGGTLKLSPGGLHVMLLGLKRPLVAGETLPLQLTFEKAGAIDVKATVEALVAPRGDARQ